MSFSRINKKFKKHIPISDNPLLTSVDIDFSENINLLDYPFSLPIIKNIKSIEFKKPVTFFVGENGTGKSTILESIAHAVGFGLEDGSKNSNFIMSNLANYKGVIKLAECMKLNWSYKPIKGYFFRAESFFNVANYIDITVDNYRSYGGKPLNSQSHGESFFSFFSSRLDHGGLYILDEPEAALSPSRQIALLKIIHDISVKNRAQLIISTHSPILLSYPNSTIYSCENGELQEISYSQSEHYQLTKDFLNNYELFLNKILLD